jgi:hypothetical protein
MFKFAVHADDVTEVKAFRQRPVCLADLLFANQDLNFAGPVPDIQEDDLSGPPLEKNSAGSPDPRTLLHYFLSPSRLGADSADNLAL